MISVKHLYMAGVVHVRRKWSSFVVLLAALDTTCAFISGVAQTPSPRTEKPVIAVGYHFDRLISKYKSWCLPLQRLLTARGRSVEIRAYKDDAWVVSNAGVVRSR